MKARREAMAADVVVINHHLFFADLAVRDSGVAELLPSVASRSSTRRTSSTKPACSSSARSSAPAQLLDFARDMLAAGLQQARGLAPGRSSPPACERAARDLRLAAAGPLREVRGSAEAALDERAADAALRRGAARASARPATRRCDALGDGERDRARLRAARRARARARARVAALFGAAPSAGQVRWIDLSPHQARLVESPLDIRDALREQMARRRARPGSSRRRRSATTSA